MLEARTSTSISKPVSTTSDAMHHPVWFFVLAIIFILCGLFAFLAPIVSTVATSLVVGIAIGVGGIAQVIHAFRSPAWKGFFLNLLLGLVYIGGAAAFLLRPFTGAFVLTAVLAGLLFTAGAGEIALGFRIRPQKGWPWLIVSGIVALIASVWLLLRIPIAGLFVPGIALGMALLFEGWAFIALAMAKEEPTQVEEGREGFQAGPAESS